MNNMGTSTKSAVKNFMETFQGGVVISMIGQIGVGFNFACLAFDKVTEVSNSVQGQ